MTKAKFTKRKCVYYMHDPDGYLIKTSEPGAQSSTNTAIGPIPEITLDCESRRCVAQRRRYALQLDP